MIGLGKVSWVLQDLFTSLVLLNSESQKTMNLRNLGPRKALAAGPTFERELLKLQLGKGG